MGKKVKYHYNASTLTYEKATRSIGEHSIRILAFVALSALFGFLSTFIYFEITSSPKEQALQRDLNKMALQYDILDDKARKMEVVLNYLKDRDANIYRVIFETAPISENIRQGSNIKENKYQDLEGYYNSALLKRTTKTIDNLAQKIYIQSRSFDQLHNLMKNRVRTLSSIPGIQPVDNRKIKGMISGFGYRIHPIYKIVKMHTGLDFSAPIGSPIYATGNGIVTQSGYDGGYGNCVIINHGYGYQSLYAHLSKFKVRQGQRISRGNIIGYVGNSGSSTGPHLHYEVIKGNKKVNPINFFYNDLTPREYQAMLDASAKSNQSFD